MFATSYDDKHAVHKKMKSGVQHELLTMEYSRKVNKMGSERARERERVLSIMNNIFICTLESRRIPPGK